MYTTKDGQFLLAIPVKQLKERWCGILRKNDPEVLAWAGEDRRLPITRRAGVKLALESVIFITVDEFADLDIRAQLSDAAVEHFKNFLPVQK
jgi:hypothetical protein